MALIVVTERRLLQVHVDEKRICPTEGQQLLPIPPQNLFAHLRLKLNLERLKILHSVLRCNEWIVGAEKEAIL